MSFFICAFFSTSFFPIILWSNSDGPRWTHLLCFPFWQSNFIKLLDGGLQYEVIRTFFDIYSIAGERPYSLAVSMFWFLKKGWVCSQSGLIGPNHLLFTSDPLLGCPPSCAELVNKSKATTHKKTCMISRNKWAKLLILTIQLSYYSSTTFLSLLTVSSKWERDRDLRLLHSV